MSIRTALITGGTGFIGSNLLRRLVHDGWNVHLISISNNPRQNIDLIDHRVTVHIHEGSTEGMLGIVTAAQPDVVFHLASLFLSEHAFTDISRLVTSNVLFGTQLLEAMAMNEVTRIVNTGTSWQHYENLRYSPVNLYAATKQAFEDILLYFVEARGLQAITLKLFDTYGPNDQRPKLFHLLEKSFKENSALVMSPGDQMIDLVHVDDVVQAFVMAAERLFIADVKQHEHYGVSSGFPLPLKDLVNLYCRVTGKQLPIKWGGRAYRVREVMVTCDNLLILPEWFPQIKLEEGLQKVFGTV
jgi:nucleoside-diphosphate-sugar epimerase